MGGAFCAALAVGVGLFLALGHGPWSVLRATQSTARIAFVFFWLAYTGGALALFFGPRLDGLARRRRELGLAFAAALLVHLGFVALLFHVSYPRPVSNEVIFWFGIGAAWCYALALGSILPVRGLWRARPWRIFSALGLEYIAYLFFRDFVLLPLQYGAKYPLFYAPFAILSIVGPLLRWSATIRRWYPGTKTA